MQGGRWSNLANDDCRAEVSSAHREDGLMPATALFVHVPVDRLVIVGCPGTKTWEALDHELEPCGYDDFVHFEMTLTFKTAASQHSFRRKTVITSTHSHHGDGFYFKGIFCGARVEGFINKRSRTGWMNLDF